MGRLSAWTLLALGLLAFAATVQDVRADVPSENECRPYIEKALHELKGDAAEDAVEVVSAEDDTDDDDDDDAKSPETDTDAPDSTPETSPEDDGDDDGDDGADDDGDDDKASAEDDENASETTSAADDEDGDGDDDNDDDDDNKSGEDNTEEEAASREKRSAENADDDDDADDSKTDDDAADDDDSTEASSTEAAAKSVEEDTAEDDTAEDVKASVEDADSAEVKEADSKEEEEVDSKEEEADDDDEAKSTEAKSEEDGDDAGDDEDDNKSAEKDDDDDDKADSKEEEEEETTKSGESEAADDKSAEDADDDDDNKSEEEASASPEASAEKTEEDTDDDTEEASREKRDVSGEDKADGDDDDTDADDDDDKSEAKDSKQDETDDSAEDEKAADEDSEEDKSEVTKPVQSFPEDDLLIEYIVPTNLRDHSHVTEILRLDEEFDEKEAAINKVADVVLKDLKKIYENAIKPLETLYKYRDLSNRHFGDPEIFSKPLVLFMGPWSGGKSTILNYLTENEHTDDSLRTGAEPSPAYFNILMHGDKPEVLDGTQLAADWTFSGLQKFGQGLEDRLRGQKLPHKLLEKVNIVEIPGILEVRKQVSRLFPFNDACQWFIDRADIIFLVYDPSKLDVGPETEAILDQLKGREYQTRILLNKADQVKPEELLRVQGALIWNISPLMSSAQPPVMYTTSLWSHPYEEGAPVRLLQAQERALLRDLRASIDKRIDNKIASARRFAVRVRNHAKMVDCYLTTYYNHKTLFGNKNLIANNIIENPQNYHIYEGLSTLTNISRYDLPDPDVYRDFFRLNKLYDFQKLSETCTYFRGCPINKLDVAIAYDLPELVGKYKKAAEAALISIEKKAEGGKS